MKNLYYRTDEIPNYYSQNRIKWHQFYPSERKLFESIELLSSHTVLDIGCGCGGLGLALNEKFDITSYTGIDINSAAIDAGRQLTSSSILISGDILDLTENSLNGQVFDLVCSLSCIDYNVQFSEMLLAAWAHVKPGGKFVATFRLCMEEGSTEIKDSYQYINFKGKKEGEIAPYVVLNFAELMADLEKFNPSEITATGYWGSPSASAVTPHDKLCFAAFSITKRQEMNDGNIQTNFDLPDELVDMLQA